VDLTNEDVADILALLDSLPYDALDLRTDRFHLTLRRTPGGWTEESELLTQPTDVTPEASEPGRAGGADGGRGGQTGGAGETVRADGSGGAGRAGGQRGGRTGGAGETGRADPGVGGATRSDGAPGGDEHAFGGADETERLAVVVAPLPGTFYRSPRPGAPPFVSEGDAVGADTVVAIIETMKLMNSVPAGTPGRVARILVGNGEFAPLGATLLLIEPDSPTPIDPDS
jgi:acetyl-CoA carboxylase biotin carboxyl carrier protein